MNYADIAEKSIRGLALSEEECHAILRTPEGEILTLLQAAFRVRETYFGRKVHLHLLINAKSGLCLENCAYCSQSAASQAAIEKYPLLEEEKLVKGAQVAKAAKAMRYCIVTSGVAPSKRELARVCQAVKKIKQEIAINICTSLGFLTESAARALKEAGVDRYNHNLNASESFYPEICTTHTYQDRLKTLKIARAAGLELCCGAIFGMGETESGIVRLTFAFRELRPDSIPINFLHPISGTPLEKVNYLTPIRCLAILCLVRFLNPAAEIRVAGGREFNLRSLQPLCLYPANSIFVSGYLTTSGQTPEEAWQMVRDMGFEVEQEITDGSNSSFGGIELEGGSLERWK